MVLIISGISLIISLLFITFSDKINNKLGFNDASGVGIIGVIISMFFGFGLCATTIPIDTKEIQIKSYEFIEGKYHYVLDMSNDLIVVDDGKNINALLNDKNVTLRKVIKLNSYGWELSQAYDIETKEQ